MGVLRLSRCGSGCYISPSIVGLKMLALGHFKYSGTLQYTCMKIEFQSQSHVSVIGPTTTLQCLEEVKVCVCILSLNLLLLLQLPLRLTYLPISTRTSKGIITTSTAPRNPSSRNCPIAYPQCISHHLSPDSHHCPLDPSLTC
jgi:hypothetical protein